MFRFATLQQWYGDPEHVGEEHLDFFNDEVKKRLAPRILRDVGGSNLPLTSSCCVAAFSSLPRLANTVAKLAQAPDPNAAEVHVPLWASRVCMDFLFDLILPMFAMHLGYYLLQAWTARIQPRSPWSKHCLALLISFMTVGSVAAANRVFSAVNSANEDSWLPALPFFALVASTSGLLLRGRCNHAAEGSVWARQKRGESLGHSFEERQGASQDRSNPDMAEDDDVFSI